MKMGPSSEGRCWFWDKDEPDPTTPKCKLFHCWGGRGNAEYDLLEAPFWGFGVINELQSEKEYIRYTGYLPTDRLYMTMGNASGYCSPWADGNARGGGGSSSFFHTKGMTLPSTAGELTQHTWIYAFVFDISGVHAYRWRADDTVNLWPGMPVDSKQLLADLDDSSIPYWDGEKLHETATATISNTPEALENWTPAWKKTSKDHPEKPVLIYIPSCVETIDGNKNKFYDKFCYYTINGVNCPEKCDTCNNWWEAYEMLLPFKPDELLPFVPGCDDTVMQPDPLGDQGCYTIEDPQDRWECPIMLSGRTPEGCGWRISQHCTDWQSGDGCGQDPTNFNCRQCSTPDGKCMPTDKHPDGFAKCGDGKDPNYCIDDTAKEKCGRKGCTNDDVMAPGGVLTYGLAYDTFCCYQEKGASSGCNVFSSLDLPYQCRECSIKGNTGGYANCDNLTPNCSTEELRKACPVLECCNPKAEGCSLMYDEECKKGGPTFCIGTTGCRRCAVTKGSCPENPDYPVCK